MRCRRRHEIRKKKKKKKESEREREKKGKEMRGGKRVKGEEREKRERLSVYQIYELGLGWVQGYYRAVTVQILNSKRSGGTEWR